MKNLLYIGNKLSEQGNTVTSIEVLGTLLEQEGYAMQYASSRKNKIFRLAEMVWKTIRYRNSDYVLIDTYSTQNFWYAFVVSQACRLFHTKYIPILHGGNLPVRLKNNPFLCRMIFKNAFVNVAPSGYLLQVFRTSRYDKIVHIPNPFETGDFPFLGRKEIAPRLLWVRSFSPIYNPEMALKVIARLKNEFPDAALCMVGPDKGLMEKMKQIAKAANLNVTFTGKLSKPEWASLSRQYDVFINTAHSDNAPYSILEAAALGMVIVSTNVGGIPHLLEHRKSAVLVDDNDAIAMASAISEIIENSELREKLLANSRHLAKESDWNSVKQKWFEILV